MALPGSWYGGGGGGGGGLSLYTPDTNESPDAELTQRRRELSAVARLAHGNDSDREKADRFLKDNAARYTDADLENYGLQRPGHDSRSLFDKARGAGFGAIKGAFGLISRPQQTVAHGLRAVGTELAGVPLMATGQVSPGDWLKTGLRGAGETWRSAVDIQGKHDINTREMLNLDKGAGGSGWVGDYVVGGLDLAGQMVTDPLSWVGGAGTKEAAKLGAKAAAEAEARGLVEKGLAARVAREGGQVYSQADREAIRQVAREMTEGAGKRGRLASRILGEGDKAGGPLRQLKEGAAADAATRKVTGERAGSLLSGDYWRPAGTGLKGADRAAENAVNQFLIRGQRGLKFGGETVLSSAKMRAPFESAGIIGKSRLVDNPAIAEVGAESEQLLDRIAKTTQRMTEAEEGKRAWASKSSEALPEATRLRDEAKLKADQLAQKLKDTDPEVYTPPGMVPNPDRVKAGQDLLRHNAKLKDIEAQMDQLDELDKAREAQRADIQKQIENLQATRENLLTDPKFAGAGRDGLDQADATIASKIEELRAAAHDLDVNDDLPDKMADLMAEHDRVGQLADEAASTPDEVYAEGRLDPNPEVNPRARIADDTPVTHGEGISPGSKSITLEGKGTVDYYVDQNGVVQIDGITTLGTERGKGVAERLLSEVEQATGQPRTAFELGDGAEEGSEGFWKKVTGREVDPETRQLRPAEPSEIAERPVGNSQSASKPTRRSLAGQVQDAQRELARAEARVKRLEGRVAVTSEKQVARAEGKLQRLQEHLDGLLERQAKTTERLDSLPPQAESYTPSRFLRTEDAMTRVRRAFNTGSEVGDVHGARVREALKGFLEKNLGTATSRSGYATRQLRNVMNAAVKEDKGFIEEFPDIYHALETGGAEDYAAKLAAADRPEAAKAVRTLINMNAEDTAAMVSEGWLPEEMLHTEGGGYMRRTETAAGEKARLREEQGVSRGSPARRASLNNADARQGAMQARSYKPGATVREINPELTEAAGLKKGQVLSDNPFYSVGTHRTELEHGRAFRQYVEDVKGLRDDAGLPVLTDDADIARTHGFVPVSTPEGKLYAPKAIAEEVGRFQAITFNDETLKAFQRTMDKTMRIWKAHATVPLVGFAFHARNAETNVMLNWIAGVENPVWYTRSARLQRKLGQAMDALGTKADNIEEAMNVAKLSEYDKRMVRLAQEHNVLNTSQTAQDLAGVGAQSAEARMAPPVRGAAGRAKQAAQKLNPLNPETFVGTTTGHAVAGGLENNARLAHFMWAMDKYGDADIAAQSVKKYLFDYADLTNFEREKLKRVIPFYTFMRKNVGLMATTLAENPGKMSRFAMVQRQTEDPNAGFLAGELIPGYINEQGQTARKGVPGLGGLTASIESPWSAAADAVSPAASALGLVPGVGRVVPDEFKEGGPEETALKLLNIPGGPAAESIKYIVERATGKDTFTGADVRALNPLGEGLRIMDIFAPSPSKIARLTDKGTQGDITGAHKTPAEGSERTRRRAAAVVNALFGLNTNAVGPQATEAELTRRFYELADYIDVRNKDLKPTDPRYIPTIEELRKAGILPSGSKKSSALTLGG